MPGPLYRILFLAQWTACSCYSTTAVHTPICPHLLLNIVVSGVQCSRKWYTCRIQQWLNGTLHSVHFMGRIFSCVVALLDNIITAVQRAICGLCQCWIERWGICSIESRVVLPGCFMLFLEVNSFFQILSLNLKGLNMNIFFWIKSFIFSLILPKANMSNFLCRVFFSLFNSDAISCKAICQIGFLMLPKESEGDISHYIITHEHVTACTLCACLWLKAQRCLSVWLAVLFVLPALRKGSAQRLPLAAEPSITQTGRDSVCLL